MSRPSPVHGTPIHSLSEVASMAMRADAAAGAALSPNLGGGMGGITGSGNPTFDLPFQTNLQCFEIRSCWRQNESNIWGGNATGCYWVCDAIPVSHWKNWTDGDPIPPPDSFWQADTLQSGDMTTRIWWVPQGTSCASSSSSSGSDSGDNGEPPCDIGKWVWCVYDYASGEWRILSLAGPGGGGGTTVNSTLTIGTVNSTLNPGDQLAQVNVYDATGQIISGGPFNAVNAFSESCNPMPSNPPLCLLMPSPFGTHAGPGIFSNVVAPWVLLRVMPITLTNWLPSFDPINGNWTRTPQTFQAAGTTPIGTTDVWIPGAQPGSDLQRDDTTTTVSVTPTSVGYGTPVTYTITVSHASGTGAVTGSVSLWSPSLQVTIGTAAIGSGGVTTIVANLPVATYSDVVATYYGDSNYNSSSSSAASTVTVSPNSCTLTVTSNYPTHTYGDSITFTAVLSSTLITGIGTGSITGYAAPSGLVQFYADGIALGLPCPVSNGSGPAYYYFTLTGVNTLLAGSRSITATYIDDPNFSASNTPYTQTITKAVITVTAVNATSVYGSAPPTYTVTYTGFKLSDTQYSAISGNPGFTCSVTTTTEVGTYTLTPTTGTLTATNYTFSFVAGTCTVIQAPLTITPDDKSMVHGGTLPAFTSSTVGIVNSDTITVTCGTSTDGSTPGSYVIDVISVTGAHSSDYILTENTGTLTVT